MINIGTIGCGFVGGALKDWLEHNSPECKLFISDPAKSYNDDMKEIDIAFLQICLLYTSIVRLWWLLSAEGHKAVARQLCRRASEHDDSYR